MNNRKPSAGVWLMFDRLFLVGWIIVMIGSGCSLIPKSVEFGQKRVQAIPGKTARTLEAEKQAAAFVASKVGEAKEAALVTGAATNVVAPLREAEAAADGLMFSLGAPAAQWRRSGDELAQMLGRNANERERAIDKMRDRQAPLVGKKIEGTGWLQIPYVLWIVIVSAACFALYVVFNVGISFLKTAYPPVGIGIAGLQSAGRLAGHEAAQGLGMVVKGIDGAREEFAQSHVAEDLKKWIDGVIIRHQQASQTSPKIQTVIRAMTSKP